ncbi:MAG: serine acetyltransferase [Verrucomicrobiota bacterium]
MFDLIREDLRAKARWCCGSDIPRHVLRVIVWDGTFATMFYRASQFCYRHHLGLLGAILNQLNPILTHAVIGRRAEFGPGLIVMHSIGLVVNTGVRAGTHCTIENGVTIGAEKGRAPVLGNHVYIGSGARIIGGVTVGNHVRIGANAVVIKDVPDYATVVGIPARVVRISNQQLIENGGTESQ